MSEICKNWTQWLKETRFAGQTPEMIEQTTKWLEAVRDVILVYADIIFRTDADPLVFFIRKSHIDREIADVFFLDGVARYLGDLRPRPVAVLHHHTLAKSKLCHRIGHLL